MTMKLCGKCGTEDRYAGGGCRPCSRANAARRRRESPDKIREGKTQWVRENPDKASAGSLRWRRKNPDKVRDHKLRHRYGIIQADKNRMWTEQNRQCAVCRKTLGITAANTDHDHETGKVRGLLCGPCNRGLGLLQESPEVLRAAASYLEARCG